jgi:hypoxanthine phosphoribosyltransferase
VTALTADPQPAPDGRTARPHDAVDFAHNSERQFAKLLDFYGIEWQYEPHTFVLEHDPRGHPLEAFSPDFFLPAYGLYIEITTLKQKLVTKKNRKVRKLQEQHPELKVTILYQRDYLNLLVKYGLESPEQLAGYGDVATSAEQGDSLLALGIFERPATS